MLEKLRLRLRRWLIGYDLERLGIELEVTGFDKMKKTLGEVAAILDDLQKRGDKLDSTLARIGERVRLEGK